MFNSFKAFISLLLMLFIFPTPADAHVIGGNGFTDGITHPLLGLDHILVMVAVGIVSFKLGGKAIWKIPVTFISLMVFGGGLAMLGVELPFTEIGIALSVLVFGTAIAFSKRFSLVGVLLCVSIFAFFHGQAHGKEMPVIAYPAIYALGFVLSTTILHITGVLIGYYAKRGEFSLKLLRYSGVVMSLFGIYFFVNI